MYVVLSPFCIITYKHFHTQLFNNWVIFKNPFWICLNISRQAKTLSWIHRQLMKDNSWNTLNYKCLCAICIWYTCWYIALTVCSYLCFYLPMRWWSCQPGLVVSWLARHWCRYNPAVLNWVAPLWRGWATLHSVHGTFESSEIDKIYTTIHLAY